MSPVNYEFNNIKNIKMILKQKLGKHEDVLFAIFGTGDIQMVKGCRNKEGHPNMLMFYNQEPHEIGEENTDVVNKTTDELGVPEFIMEFNRPESITALIHSLIELQKEVFKL